MISAPPLVTIGEERGNLIWKFARILWWQTFLLDLWQEKPLFLGLKTNGGVIFVTILLHFHFIFLETANTPKSEVILLIIFLGNVNVSAGTYWYPKICKQFLEAV